MRRVRSILLAVAFAALGATAGRFVAESRRRAAAGEPFEPTLDAVAMPGVRDLVPGLVAALRVHDRPWSYLHLPSWLAAFTVNFVIAGFGRELPFLRALGITRDEEPRHDEREAPPPPEVWTAASPRATWATWATAAPEPPAAGFRPFAG